MKKSIIISLLVIVSITVIAFFNMAFATTNPVVWYKFDETSGTTVADSSGNGKNATLTSATWAAGKYNNAVSMSGSTQYVSMPTGIVSTLNDFSIATWVKLNAVTTWTRIFDIGSSTSINMFLTPTAGSTIRYAITTSGSGGEQRINGTAALTSGTWKHVAVTLSGTTGTLYVDGVQVGTNTSMTLKPSSLGSTTLNYIGKSQYADPYLNGLVDDFRIYDRALSAAEVSSLFTGGATPTPTVPGATPTPTSTPTPTPTGGTQPVWSGGPYNFNGSNPVTTASNIGISGNSSWSVVAWIYPFSGGPGDGYGWGVAGWGSGATNQGNLLYYNGVENTFEYGFYGNDAQTAASYPPVTWYHIANTYDGTTQKIYVNGTLVTSRAPGTLSIANTTAKIGTDPFGQGRNFQGGMDAVKIYNVTLSAAEVSSLAAANPGWTPVTPTPVPTATPAPTPVPGSFLDRIEPAPGTKINSTFWNARVKNTMINWIPWCYNQLSNTSLAEGGINNFIQAGRKLDGLSYTAHVGYWFSNAYIHNTIEAMCNACMIDPQGDTAIINAQNAMRTKLADWIPKILSAQEDDGYLHTWTTLGNNARWTSRDAHEGYTAGYFMEAAIAHYMMTNKTDATLYNAAKKLADCWCNNIGPSPKKTWWDGHEEIEQALCRFGVFVNQNEGGGAGDKYIQLAKFLMDSRYSGSSGQYDQSHAYPINQTTAVGHSVRAAYLYSGMADVGMLLNNASYINASNVIWDNLVNRKMYITGGLGSGETSEGFGADYSLRNNSYCESCANCGMMMFQSKMNYMYQDAKYADLVELAYYNGVLGSLDLNANNFTYTNPLDSSSGRYTWHSCPCCVGNIPKTTLAFPRWMYAKTSNALYVNMFVGSTVTVNGVGGTNVQMVQSTDYPWSGNVTLTVNPTAAANFTVKIRVPDRSVSTCYSSTPNANGITSITVNDSTVSPTINKGYAEITRTWTAGDHIDLVLPMVPQRVKAVSNVTADVGRVCLQYGPLIYNIESVDQNVGLILSPTAPLTANWNASLLGGVMTINGNFTSGAAMTAIPNYARLNRGGQSIVWLRDQ